MTVVDADAILRRASEALPGGVSSGNRAAWGDVIIRAQGAYLWNAGGQKFIDYLLGWGPIVIGHCDPRVNEAVSKSIARCDLNAIGPQMGEVELAEMVIESMPSAERVAFCTSGTEASLHAAHLARAMTGRGKLVKFFGSYHGWHDYLAVGSRVSHGPAGGTRQANSAGLHPSVVEDTYLIEWNSFEQLRDLFAHEGSSIAAVFAEPYIHSYGCVAPSPGFLEELRSLATDHGSVLVFDEVKTGFRHALGGYQEICGVTPDLTMFGKAIANGYALAGLAGRADLMDHLGLASEDNATLDGTYNGAPYALAAGIATLGILRDEAIEILYERGERLREGIAEAIAESGAKAVVTGIGSSWAIYFRETAPNNFREASESDLDAANAYQSSLLEQGVLEPMFALGDRRLCAATSTADIDQTVAAVRVALKRVAEATN